MIAPLSHLSWRKINKSVVEQKAVSSKSVVEQMGVSSKSAVEQMGIRAKFLVEQMGVSRKRASPLHMCMYFRNERNLNNSLTKSKIKILNKTAKSQQWC